MVMLLRKTGDKYGQYLRFSVGLLPEGGQNNLWRDFFVFGQ